MTTRNGNHHHRSNGKAATVATAVQEITAVEPADRPAPVPDAAATPPGSETAVLEPAGAPVTGGPGVAATEEPPPPPEEPVKPPGKRGRQDTKTLVLLAETDDRLTGLEMADEPLPSLMAAHRITTERLAGVRVLYDNAQNTVSTRDTSMIAEAGAIIDMQRALRQTNVVFGSFRHVGRILFPDPVADRTAQLAFQLDEDASSRINLFIDRGRRVLIAARKEPQASRLAAAGYDSERLDEIEAHFDALDLLYEARCKARQAAINATTARNAAVAELRVAMHQLRVEVAAILRAHPEVNAPANFF